jgi:hypothetical protein
VANIIEPNEPSEPILCKPGKHSLRVDNFEPMISGALISGTVTNSRVLRWSVSTLLGALRLLDVVIYVVLLASRRPEITAYPTGHRPE